MSTLLISKDKVLTYITVTVKCVSVYIYLFFFISGHTKYFSKSVPVYSLLIEVNLAVGAI